MNYTREEGEICLLLPCILVVASLSRRCLATCSCILFELRQREMRGKRRAIPPHPVRCPSLQNLPCRVGKPTGAMAHNLLYHRDRQALISHAFLDSLSKNSVARHASSITCDVKRLFERGMRRKKKGRRNRRE